MILGTHFIATVRRNKFLQSYNAPLKFVAKFSNLDDCLKGHNFEAVRSWWQIVRLNCLDLLAQGRKQIYGETALSFAAGKKPLFLFLTLKFRLATMMIAVVNSFSRSVLMNGGIIQMYFYKYFYYTYCSYYFNFIFVFNLAPNFFVFIRNQ